MINKIYYLFHSIGNIFQGESVACGNLIVWKKREEFLTLLKEYINNITQEKDLIETKKRDYIPNPNLHDPFMTNFVNLSVVCGVKFIASLYTEIIQFSEIVNKYNLQIIVYADCGRLHNGYFSSILKLSNIYVGTCLNDAYKLTVIIT